uniref:hypothetical protein n=1 Tax=Stieleria sp. TaxID=2795976 RepID=UPI00356385AA
LDRRCGDDSQLRDAVMELIQADRQAGDGAFLQSHLLKPDSPNDDASTLGDTLNQDDTDRFRVLSPYRQGGLGEVLLAHDRQLDRDVAIKQIKPRWADNEEARQRFIQ